MSLNITQFVTSWRSLENTWRMVGTRPSVKVFKNGVSRADQTGCICHFSHMAVSENRGTPKSSILIGFSIVNHPFWGATIFGNPHIQLFIGVLILLQSQRSLQYFLPTCNGGSSWLHAYGVTKHDINKENKSVFFFEWQRNGQTVCHLEFSTGISKLMITQPGVIHGSPKVLQLQKRFKHATMFWKKKPTLWASQIQCPPKNIDQISI